MRKLTILILVLLVSIAFAQNRTEELRNLLALEMDGTLTECGFAADDGKPLRCFFINGSVDINKLMFDLQFSLLDAITPFTPWLGQSGRTLENDARGVTYRGEPYQVMLVESLESRFKTKVVISIVNRN